MTWGVVQNRGFRGTLKCLAMLLCLFFTSGVSANTELPPLLKQSKVLACAKSESVAKDALSSIWEIEDAEKEFPDENMLSGSESVLHAATLDIVLKSMLDASKRFPSLRNQVERTLLKWNYCDVFEAGVFYDLKQSSEGYQRFRAAETSPEKWEGFKALGFLGEVENRFIPNILALDQNSLRSDYEWLFHRIYREQCFPHPDTSELFDVSELRLSEDIFEREADATDEFPYEWDSECIYPRSPPELKTKVNVEVLPVDVPQLTSGLRLKSVPQLVPGLKTRWLVRPTEQLVPTLATQIKVLAVPRSVPVLQTSIVLSEQPITVPPLEPVIAITEVAQLVPPIATTIKIKPAALKEVAVSVPSLFTKVRLDTPKLVKATPVKASPVNYVGVPVKRPVVSTPAVITAPAVVQPSIAVNKNASLIERLLGGMSGGGNVLIVDKIQLTVNEYNGTVETAISSSDIGTTVTSTESRPEIVKEIMKSLPIKSEQKTITAEAAVVKKEVPKKSSVTVGVPRLQTMLLVSEVRKQQSNTVFTYSPNPKDKKRTKEKSVEQLLLEYQQFEKDRKLGRKPKKKAVQTVRIQSKPEIAASARDVAPLNTELWFEEISYDPIDVPSLNSKIKVYKKFIAKPVKVPPLSTMIIQQFIKKKPAEKKATPVRKDLNFEFSKDYLSDDVFEETQVKEVESISNQLDKLFDDGLSLAPSSEPKKKAKKLETKKRSLGLAGSIYLNRTLKNGNKTIGGTINRKLVKDSYWFARVGWSYSLEEMEDPFSYSWGIGYSDWHSGTFSAQLNNWGPIKPGEGLALEKAVASFGYSVKSDFLKNNKLSLSGAINVPVDGNSSVSANLRWSPIKNWYLNASVSQPLEGDGTPKWTYGFGYSDWRPNKINLQYSNYGPNEIPDHNYKENGTWSLSYNWKF